MTILTEEMLKEAMRKIKELDRPAILGFDPASGPDLTALVPTYHGLKSFAGMPIVCDPNMPQFFVREDWSKVRSPSRAERRRRQGHRQNIVIHHEPAPHYLVFGGVIHANPQAFKQIIEQFDANASPLWRCKL